MIVMTAGDVLRGAREVIDKRGWSANDTDGVSIYSAVSLSLTGKALDEINMVDIEAIDGPCVFIDQFIDFTKFDGIAAWEFRKGRSKEDVLFLLDQAIEAADAALTPGAAA